MAANGVKTSEDVDMVESDGEKVVTMMDVLQEQQAFEDDANAVLGASDDKNCTYSRGYVKRQALYACVTCCPDASTDPSKRAGVCLACSLSCHENHELVELYTKRNFRCDCGNPKFNQPCQFTPNKSDLNYDNKYNHNFSGIYCTCKRPYPDPEATEEEEMIQCIICEDWLHTNHLDATVPNNDQYAEMICKDCMDDYGFLHDYSDLVVNIADKEIIVMDPDLDFDTKFSPKKATPTKAAKKEITTNGITDNMADKEAQLILNSINSIVDDTKKNEESVEEENNEKTSEEGKNYESSTKETTNNEQNKDNNETTNVQPGPVVIEPKEDQHIEANDETLNKELAENTKENAEGVESTKENANVSESTKENAEGVESTKENADVSEITKENADVSESTKENADVSESTKENADENESTKENDEGVESTKENADVSVSIKENADVVESTKESAEVVGSTKKDADFDVTIKENAELEKSNVETAANKEMEISDNNTTVIAELTEPNNEATPEGSTSKPKNETLTSTKDTQKPETEEKEYTESSDKENGTQSKLENKRKLSTDDIASTSPKKAKIAEPCLRPKGVKKVYKGATFWPSNLRQKLCSCGECISMYKDLAVLYLIDPEDTVNAYEALGKDNADGPSSQYEKGLQALQSLDRVQQINALTEYNKMRDKLLEFLKSFKDRKEIVKEEDIKAFFAGMKPKREPDGVYFCR